MTRLKRMVGETVSSAKTAAKPFISRRSQDEMVFGKVVVKLIKGTIEKEGAKVSRIIQPVPFVVFIL